MLVDRGAVSQYLVRRQLLASGLQRGFRSLHCYFSVFQFFLRDSSGADQLRAARQIRARPVQFRSAGGDIRSQGVVVDKQRTHLAHGLRQLGFG